MKPRGSCLKAMARVKEERGLVALLAQVRSPGKKGRRPTELQGFTRSNLAMKLRMKLLGEQGHDADADAEVVNGQEPSSVHLAALVDEFHEDEANDRKRGRLRFDDTSVEDESKSFLRGELVAILHKSIDNVAEKIVLAEVNSAVTASAVGDGDGVISDVRRCALRRLRRAGLNAGLCKSRWDQSGEFPGGYYEYIDVLFQHASGPCERIVVDVDFRGQFEIARPTAHYAALVQALPTIFVGKANEIQGIINIMSEAVKLSLKKRGMHLAPWRKPEYMRAKWFSSYKRKTKLDESSDESCEGSGVSAVTGRELASEEKPAVKEAGIGNRFGTNSGGANVSNSFDNNDWRLPSLKAKKSQGPRHAGLASLFRKPAGP